MIRNLNDGSGQAPRLRTDICYPAVLSLPADSSGPHGDHPQLHKAIKEAGYRGIQNGSPELCAELGLGVTALARVDNVGEAAPLAESKKQAGFECVCLHIGSGLEDDGEACRLIEDVLRASERHDMPFYVETHRATITQDMWRTVQWISKFPELRFNGDFSHWYTGQEMWNGGIERKWEFLAPVFERVRFLHGRIGTAGAIQVDVGDGRDSTHVDHFRELWTRAFAGFLKSAAPGDYIVFSPELLEPAIWYARTITAADGTEREECDRWEQSRVLTWIAQECFDAAKQRLEEE